MHPMWNRQNVMQVWAEIVSDVTAMTPDEVKETAEKDLILDLACDEMDMVEFSLSVGEEFDLDLENVPGEILCTLRTSSQWVDFISAQIREHQPTHWRD